MVNSIGRLRRSTFQLRLEFWIARTRLKPTKVRFRRMTRLWAVCRCDQSITFSTALLDQPLAFQDLVIVHELIHLQIPDHGKFFWLALGLYQPHWRAAGRLAPESPAHCNTYYRVEDSAVLLRPYFKPVRCSTSGLAFRIMKVVMQSASASAASRGSCWQPCHQIPDRPFLQSCCVVGRRNATQGEAGDIIAEGHDKRQVSP